MEAPKIQNFLPGKIIEKIYSWIEMKGMARIVISRNRESV